MERKAVVTCYSCGRKTEYTECSIAHAPPEDAQCKVLTGWLTVLEYEGSGLVEEYDFCSFTCLQRWVDGRVPHVPDVFLKEFDDG
jgi:hypothetical protein